MKRWSIVVSLMAIATVAAGPSFAARGGNGGSAVVSDIALAAVDGDTLRAASPSPHLGGTVAFSTAIEPIAGWEYPMVALWCYQDVDGDGLEMNGVTDDVVFTWLDHPDAYFLLGGGSSIWKNRGGGPAECRADLDAYGWKAGRQSIRILDSTSFRAEG